MTITPSTQQDQALIYSRDWLRDRSKQTLYVGGYAGTGKTTIAKMMVSNRNKRWLFAAFTGKAAHVLRQRGCEGARTIHSLIYRPAGESMKNELMLLDLKLEKLRQSYGLRYPDELNDEEAVQIRLLERVRSEMIADNRPQFSLWADSPLAESDVEGVVVDECSMVDERLGRDLESFGKKILVLGDPAQLPPVKAGGYFTKKTPDFMLTEVHRQAKESGILRLATLIREGGSLSSHSNSSDAVVTRRPAGRGIDVALGERAVAVDQILVGRNETRRKINRRVRELTGRTVSGTGPVATDRVVCLRNDRKLGIFNGSQWSVLSSQCEYESDLCTMQLRSEDDQTSQLEVVSWMHHMLGRSGELDQMGPEARDFSSFDFGYALTVHKAQGSQWSSVLLFDESKSFGREDGRRWLYTGITRAEETIEVIAEVIE